LTVAQDALTYLAVFVGGALIATAARILVVRLNFGWFRQGFVGDASGHVEIIRQLRKNPRSTRIDRYVIPNTLSYPLGFHRFARFFPMSIIEHRNFIPNIVIFGLGTGIFLAYAHHLYTGVLHQEGWAALGLAGLLYFVSISNLVFRGPAIAYLGLSSRLLGRMSTALYYIALCAHLIWPDPWSIAVAVIAGAISFASSTFGAQVILFTLPLLIAIMRSPDPLWIALGAFALSLILTRRHSWKSVVHMARYWRIYRRYVAHSAHQKGTLSRFIRLRRLPKAILQMRLRELRENEPTRCLLHHPELILLACLAALEWSGEVASLVYVMVPAFVVYLLTSTRRLHHLGESYRYIEYALYFLAPFAMAHIVLHAVHPLVPWLVGVYLALVVVDAVALYATRRPRYAERDYFGEFLQRVHLKPTDVVFPVTMHLGLDLCARADCRTFWWQPGGITSPAQYEDFIEEYPYLKREWTPLREEFGVTHVICDKNALRAISWEYDFSDLRLVAEDDGYIAYEVPGTSQAGS